jgi:UDP-glucose 4-epimerase
MKILVTGSAGHLGEALMRTLLPLGHMVIGIDTLAGPFTTHRGSIADRDFIRLCMSGVDSVLHTATLHKPHVATHARQDFVDTNITGTLTLLEAVAASVRAFVFTSTTSVFGDALVPPPGAAAAWITEAVRPIPKNIYGVTKAAAEDLRQLFQRNHWLPVIVLRTSRFFPEADDDKAKREAFADENLKANEYLYRRVDLEDVVSAHLLALERAPDIGFRRYIISAATPFQPGDMGELRRDAPAVVRRCVPGYEAEYARRGWRMPPAIDRVYVSARACVDFHRVVTLLAEARDIRSPLARLVGSKGYHADRFAEGPYPVA